MNSQPTSDRRRRNSCKRRRALLKSARTRRCSVEALEPRKLLIGTWTPLTNPFPGSSVNVLDLLSDGTVMTPRFSSGGGSYKLTPDAAGSYVNGTWSSVASMSTKRSYSSQFVLPDGRLLILGGATGGVLLNVGEIYDPVTDSFTSMANFPESTFGNGPTMLLADGRLLAGSVNGPQTYLYDPATNNWSSGPTKLYGDSNNHESWTKLRDGSILTYDVNSNPQHAQRLDPSTMTWIDSGAVPVSLEAGIAGQNMGPGVLLADGRVLQLGRSSNTALYTPSTTPGGTGTWAPGRVIPGGLEAGGGNPDESDNDAFGSSTAALLPNGHVLFAAESLTINGPTRFFEFDPTAPLATSLTDVSPPITAYQTVSYAFSTRMVVLPTGQLLLGTNSGIHQPYIYTPDGAPDAAWKPTITNVVANGNHYTLTGTQLNGLSAGAYYGGSTESASNYPIIELSDGSGKVYFARTFNWSSTGVATGGTPETTDFTLPVALPSGTYSLAVIANGITSDPVLFTVALQGDFNFDGQLTGADVQAMLGALVDLNSFKQMHGLSDGQMLILGDLNGDHVVTNADLQGLLNQLLAQSRQPQLVLDIDPNGSDGSAPTELTAIGSTVYFAADDGTHGVELWKSDGTPSGTVLVKDINPGETGSSPNHLANIDGTLFFAANDGAHGVELWKSDGTEAGTVMVSDIQAGGSDSSSNPRFFTKAGNMLFFRANDGEHGNELWKTDGTTAGTVLVKDIAPEKDNSYPTNLTSFQGVLYFDAEEPTDGDELWKSDGTEAGTVMVKDIYPGSYYDPSYGMVANSSYPGPFTEFQGELYFPAGDADHGYELWKTDGAASGTVLVKDINPGPASSGPVSYFGPAYLTPVNGTLFFDADDGQHGLELWKTDGTEAGTVLVKDIVPGSYPSGPFGLTNLNGILLFDAYQDDVNGNDELFKSDGTEAGTVLVKDINPGPDGSYIDARIPINGTLFFSPDDGVHGYELWQTDGTAAGTKLIKDINPGGAPSYPGHLTNAGGTLFFTADDGTHGYELWAMPTSSGSATNSGGGSVASAVSVGNRIAAISAPGDTPIANQLQSVLPGKSLLCDHNTLRFPQLVKTDRGHRTTAIDPTEQQLLPSVLKVVHTATVIESGSASNSMQAAFTSGASTNTPEHLTATQFLAVATAHRDPMIPTAVDQVLSAGFRYRSRRTLHAYSGTANHSALDATFASDSNQFEFQEPAQKPSMSRKTNN
jgi:ELWxxDGT repeat protein